MADLGGTKLLILKSCISPRSWTELKKIIDMADTTLTDHLKQLVFLGFLGRDADTGKYTTTARGIEALKQTPAAKYKNIVPAKLLLAGVRKNLNSRDRLNRVFAELSTRGLLGKEVEVYYRTIGEAVISSISIQTPNQVQIDEKAFRLVNDLIGQLLLAGASNEKGQLTITISFDFPKELDIKIRDETDPNIKELLVQNRKMIIDKVIDNWPKLFSRTGLLA